MSVYPTRANGSTSRSSVLETETLFHPSPETKQNDKKLKSSKLSFSTMLRIRPLLPHEREQEQKEQQQEVKEGDNPCAFRNIKSCHSHGHSVELLPPPPSSKTTTSSFSSSTSSPPHVYSFHTILPPTSTQEQVYQSIFGKRTDTQSPPQTQHHVIVSLGVSNSGKTYTLLNSGSGSPNSGRDLLEKKEEEGILFQWTRDFFAHSSSFFQGGGMSGSRRSKTEFAIQVSMIYIYKEQVYDLLGHSTQEEEFSWKKKNNHGNVNQESHPTSFQKLKRTSSFHVSSMIASMETQTNQNHETKKKNTHHDTLKNSIHTNHSHGRNSSSSSGSSSNTTLRELRIVQHPITKDFSVSPTVVHCTSMEHAFSIFQSGLSHSTMASTHWNTASSRGHTLITLRPIQYQVEPNGQKIPPIVSGGIVTLVDMAGIERAPKPTTLFSSSSMVVDIRTSTLIHSSISTLLSCLRILKQNHSILEEKNMQQKKQNHVKDPSSHEDQPKNTMDEKENQTYNTFLSPKSKLRMRFHHHHHDSLSNTKALSTVDETGKDILERTSTIKQIKTPKKSQRQPDQSQPQPQLTLVPYRESKLTMILQPLFTGDPESFMKKYPSDEDHKETSFKTASVDPIQSTTITQTTVTLLVSAYPGYKDYYEKKYLLDEVSRLQGLSMLEAKKETEKPIFTRSLVKNVIHHVEMSNKNGVESSQIDSPTTSLDDYDAPTKIKNGDKPWTVSSTPTSLNNEKVVSHPSFADDSQGDISITHLSKKSWLKRRSPLKIKNSKDSSAISSITKNKDTVSATSSNKDDEWGRLCNQVQQLEEENGILKERNQQLQQKCQQLEEENQSLKRTLEKRIKCSPRTKKSPSKKEKLGTKNHSDHGPCEEDTMKYRNVRRKQQTLIPSPLLEHMKIVEEQRMIETGAVGKRCGGKLSNKAPFPLTVTEGHKRRKKVNSDLTHENEEADMWRYLADLPESK